MLTIKDEDFGEKIANLSGITFWLERIPGFKNPVVAAAWPDLIILRPDLQMPDTIKGISNRKFLKDNQSVHIFWSPKTQRYAHITTVKVPSLIEVHSLDVETLDKVEVQGTIPIKTPKWLLFDGYGFSALALKRAVLALDIEPDEIDIRTADLSFGKVFIVIDEDRTGAVIGCIESSEIKR